MTAIGQGVSASRSVEVAGRLGMLARSAVYLVLAALAFAVALRGDAGPEADSVGAIGTFAEQPAGGVLLWVLAACLAAYAAWRVGEVVTGRTSTEEDAGPLTRAASAVRAAIYLALALAAVRATTAPPSSGAERQQDLTATVLGWPFGRWLVGAAGSIVVVLALAELWKGVSGRFMRRLEQGHLREGTQDAVRLVGGIGHAGRGVAYGLVGVFVVVAALEHDPSKSRGLDGALGELVREPYGLPVLLSVAVGLAAFGIYSLAEARWRRIRA